MTGHVRQRGGRWEILLELGEQAGYRCPACTTIQRVRRKDGTEYERERGTVYWADEDRPDVCPKCGGDFEDVLARRQELLPTRYETKKVASKALRDALTARERGDYVKPVDMTLAAYLVDSWLPSLAGRDLTTNTVQAYTLHVNKRIVPHLGTTPLQGLTRVDCQRFAGVLATTPGSRGKVLSPATRLAVLTVLRHALGDATDAGLLRANPAAGMRRPRVRKSEMKTWSREELLAFLEAGSEDRLRPLWQLLATTGMRRGEALGLRWQDVDLAHGTISVQRQRKAAGYVVEEGPTKTGEGRSVRLRGETVASLKAWKAAQSAERLAWGAGWKDTGHVFTREDGQPWHPDRITKLFELAMKRTKARRIRLHDLRHTFATLALKAGVHIKVVSECLGHKDPQMTLRAYSHVTPDIQEASLGLMDAYMAAAGGPS